MIKKGRSQLKSVGHAHVIGIKQHSFTVVVKRTESEHPF